jgi:hypothetical protein
VTNRPMFAPSTNDPNQWSADGNQWTREQLDQALKIALLYYDSDYDDVPDTVAYFPCHVGEVAGAWKVCEPDGTLPNGQKVDGDPVAVTWATLAPKAEPDPSPGDADTEPFGEQWAVYSEVADTRRRIHAEADGASVETADWDDPTNANQLAAAAGKVADIAETVRLRGRRGAEFQDGPAKAVLREDLLTVAAVAVGWVETIDRTG